MAKNKLLPVHVPETWHESVRRIAEEAGVSSGELVRRCLIHTIGGAGTVRAAAETVKKIGVSHKS